MDTLLDFVELIIDVWKTSSFGIGMEKMLIAFLIFLSFAFVRGLFSRFVLQKMSSLAAKTETQMDDVMIVSLERPLKFFFLVIGLFFAVEYLQLSGLSAVIAEKLLKSFVAVGLFWFFYAAVTPLSYTLHNLESILSKEIVNWLVTVARWGSFSQGLQQFYKFGAFKLGLLLQVLDCLVLPWPLEPKICLKIYWVAFLFWLRGALPLATGLKLMVWYPVRLNKLALGQHG